MSIENGRLILTMMPSLRCRLNCPHCYLSTEQRRSSAIINLNDIEKIIKSIDVFFMNKIADISVYWYGGEPTEMGIDYFDSAIKIINDILKRHRVHHVILTSLISIDEKLWFPFFKKYCNNYFQTSYDFLMRGEKYHQKLKKKIMAAKNNGLNIGTISVLNSTMLEAGAAFIFDELTDLGVSEISILPFMLNEQNKNGKYQKYSPTMKNWNQFMMDITDYRLSKNDSKLPVIGQEQFIFKQRSEDGFNIADQTIFLLPDGSLALPDYRKSLMLGSSIFKEEEYLNIFGNVLQDSFKNIINGEKRKQYLRKQLTRNHNEDCLSCDFKNCCVMEFWKKNNENDDCFGGKKYIEHIFSLKNEIQATQPSSNSLLF